MTYPTMNPLPLGPFTPVINVPDSVLKNNTDLLETMANAVEVEAPASNGANVGIGISTCNPSTLAGVLRLLPPGTSAVIDFPYEGNKLDLTKLYVANTNGSDKIIVSAKWK